MINKISVNSTSNKQQYPKNQPNFGDGIGQMFLSAVQMCEAEPMVNVAVADLATAIIPRTIVEGQTNVYGGFEAFRRESSGLIINCMIPGFIALGIAKIIQNHYMDEGSKMAGCWANEDSLNMVKHHWDKASADEIRQNGKVLYKQGSNEAKVYNTYKNILSDIQGIDGNKEVHFNKFNFDESIHKLTEETLHPKAKAKFLSSEWSANRKAVKKAKKAAELAGKEYVADDAFSQIIHKTRTGSNIKFKNFKIFDKNGKAVGGTFSQKLGDIISNTPQILRELTNGKNLDAGAFVNKAKKLLTAKSLGGLAIILPLAISAQPINRWLTQRASGVKGAPIYNDFENSKHKELSSQEKSALFKQKIISIGSMIGVALLSIGKMPGLSMAKNISQFKSRFPSLDQARLVSTATFASRMGASQDRNDLREATYRDIATFSTFYFLNDYVEKAFATVLEKTNLCKSRGIKLINELQPRKEGQSRIRHWISNTALKSSAEVYGTLAKDTKYAKNVRTVTQLVNLGFQLVTLGIIIPKVYRKKTEKEHAKELELQKMEMAKKSSRHCETSSSGCA